MDKKIMDEIRASVLNQGEVLKVIYTGMADNFPKGKIIQARPTMAKNSGLKYPQPKWIACRYCITDSDGDTFVIADDKYGELHNGFEWIKY